MTSYRIWIPSKQKYIRMYEINCEQYRCILKSLDDDYEFDFALNQLLIQNLYDKFIQITEFTVIDKFVIFLQLKIHSCDSKLKLTRVCQKCEAKTSFAIDLNQFIDSLAKSIDRPFEQTFDFGTTQITCDVPSIQLNEDYLFDREDFGQRLDTYLYSFIQTLYLNGQKVELSRLSFLDKTKICQTLPFRIISTIKEQFIDSLHRMFQELLVVKVACSNDKCKDELVMNFDINNMTDVTRILFHDTSAISLLSQIANISTNCHLDYSFYKHICPAELDILAGMVSESNKQPEQQQSTNNEINMFDKFSLETEGMVETPSEFL